jgi:hypothetical protein
MEEKNLEMIIQEYLLEHGPTRKMVLVGEFKGKYTGASKPNLMKKIREWIKQEKIIKINYEQAKKMGIHVEDKNAIFLAGKDYPKIKKQIDTAFNYLNNKNENIIETALIEIESYQKITLLTQDQINKLLNTANQVSEKLVEIILRILYFSTKKGINLNENKKHEKILEDLLIKYKNTKNSLLKQYLLALLSQSNKAIITQLKHELETNKGLELEKIEKKYLHKKFAKIIEENREDLFKYEIKLQKKNKVEAIQTLRRIRTKAKNHLGFSKSMDGETK